MEPLVRPSSMDEFKKRPEGKLTDEGLENVTGFYHILRRIHSRLVIEGYFHEDGKTWNIFKVAKPLPYDPEDYEVWD